MSWQAYIDQIKNSVTCKLVVIAGHDGSIWSEYHTDNVATAAEMKVIVDNLKRDASDFNANGIRVAGEKYFSLQGETGKQIYGKKGQVFLVAALTYQAIILAVSGEGEAAGNFNMKVLKLADYLKENNY